MTEAIQPDPHDALRAYMREQVKLTPSRKPSGYASVVAVLPEIRALKAKRTTDAEIKEMLDQMGVKLRLATLRHYIQTAIREAAGHKPVRRRGKVVAKSSVGTGSIPPSRPAVQGQPMPPTGNTGPSRGHGSAANAVAGHRLSTRNL